MRRAWPLVGRSVATEFHRLYYGRRSQTWENTYWLGAPVQKLPLDLWVMQEIVYETRPDVLVETGVNQGGSALFWASLFDLIGHGELVAVDIDVSAVDERLARHPRVTLLEGSSTDPAIVATVRARAAGRRVGVLLDSDHRAEHVRAELDAYGPLVSPGCYLVVEDTNVGGHPVSPGFGAGPLDALVGWLPQHPEFTVDRSREKLLVSFNPSGYLRRR